MFALCIVAYSFVRQPVWLLQLRMHTLSSCCSSASTLRAGVGCLPFASAPSPPLPPRPPRRLRPWPRCGRRHANEVQINEELTASPASRLVNIAILQYCNIREIHQLRNTLACRPKINRSILRYCECSSNIISESIGYCRPQ